MSTSTSTSACDRVPAGPERCAQGTQTVAQGPSRSRRSAAARAPVQEDRPDRAQRLDPDDLAARCATRSATDGTVYPKGTAIPHRADFNTLDNPFAWTADPKRDRLERRPAAGVHFVVFNPSSDDFDRNRLAMDGVLPDGTKLALPPRTALRASTRSSRRRTARTSSCRRGGTARSRSPSCEAHVPVTSSDAASVSGTSARAAEERVAHDRRSRAVRAGHLEPEHGGERAGDGEVRAEVEAEQQRTRVRRQVCREHDRGREVVDGDGRPRGNPGRLPAARVLHEGRDPCRACGERAEGGCDAEHAEQQRRARGANRSRGSSPAASGTTTPSASRVAQGATATSTSTAANRRRARRPAAERRGARRRARRGRPQRATECDQRRT